MKIGRNLFSKVLVVIMDRKQVIQGLRRIMVLKLLLTQASVAELQKKSHRQDLCKLKNRTRPTKIFRLRLNSIRIKKTISEKILFKKRNITNFKIGLYPRYYQ